MVLTILNTLKIIHFLLSNIYSCLERSLIFHKEIPYIYIYIYLPIDRFIDRGALKKESWKREAQSARYSTSKDWALAARVYWLAVWFD